MREPWTLGRKAMVTSLAIFHVIAVVLATAALRSDGNTRAIESMFTDSCIAIWGTLGLLVVGKRFKDVDLMKFGNKKDKQDASDAGE